MNLYTIRDQPGGFFMPPFCAQNDAIAERMFISSLGDSFAHRSGFSLHRVGKFDDDTGQLTAVDPEMILAGTSIRDELDPRPRPALPKELSR